MTEDSDLNSEQEEARRLVHHGWEALRPEIPDGSDSLDKYRNWVATARQSGAVSPSELEIFIIATEEAIFGRPPFYGAGRLDIDPSDSRLVAAVDAREAMMLLEPDDPANPWNLGNVLFAVGRYSDAAYAFLMAYHVLSKADEQDEESAEWRDWAAYHAAKNFVLAGSFLTAALVLSRVPEANRAKVRALLDEKFQGG